MPGGAERGPSLVPRAKMDQCFPSAPLFFLVIPGGYLVGTHRVTLCLDSLESIIVA